MYEIEQNPLILCVCVCVCARLLSYYKLAQ